MLLTCSHSSLLITHMTVDWTCSLKKVKLMISDTTFIKTKSFLGQIFNIVWWLQLSNKTQLHEMREKVARETKDKMRRCISRFTESRFAIKLHKYVSTTKWVWYYYSNTVQFGHYNVRLEINLKELYITIIDKRHWAELKINHYPTRDSKITPHSY